MRWDESQGGAHRIKGNQQKIWKQRQEHQEFKANLCYMRHCTTDRRNHGVGAESSRKVLWMRKPGTSAGAVSREAHSALQMLVLTGPLRS